MTTTAASETSTIGLWNIAAEQPERIAVVDPDGTEYSYGDLSTKANIYGRGFQALGLAEADAIVVLQPNGTELLAAYFAAIQSGLYVVVVNWHLTAPEIAYILRDSEAKVLLAHERFADVACAAANEAGVPEHMRFAVGSIDGFRRIEELGSGEGDGRPPRRTSGSPMLYTSGTTGRPKGVRRPLTGVDPDQVPAASTWFFNLFGLQPSDDDVHLCGSPLYHTAVLNFVSISIQLGHIAVVMDSWDPKEMLKLIERYRVTHSHMVPTQFRRLLDLDPNVRRRYDMSSLRAMIHGAAPCPHQVKRDMLDWWGPVVTEYYAATEGGGTVISGSEWLRKPGSVGKPWPGSTVKILDDSGAELPAGQVGSVYMKMGDATFEYHKDEKKTKNARVGELFTLGDIGYLDNDGYLYLHDRKNDMIISGGVNIYPAEIESELVIHPKIADVAVFGVPDDEWGEQVKAVVQPVDHVEIGERLSRELLSYAAGRLAKFKLPRTIDYIRELPRDPNGKLYKRALRDPYWEGRSSAI